MIISINTNKESSRLAYIVDWLNDKLAYEVAINNPDEGAIIINYGDSIDTTAHVNIPDQGLLFEVGVQKQNIKVLTHEGVPYFYGVKEGGYDLPFDFFSLTFFLLSRYEEYLLAEVDEHGRWKSDQSLAVQNEFIQIPIVDIWLKRFSQIISHKTKLSVGDVNTFNIIPTIDIDIPLSYYKNRRKKYGALIRDILWGSKTKMMFRVGLYKNNRDPFDTYQYLIQQLKGHPKTIFFFLCKYKKPYDENHLVKDPRFKKIINHVKGHFEIGIHPSYTSDSSKNKINLEKKILEKLSNSSILKSRQHYLKMSLPKTYSSLIKADITEDHTMMYADQIGFRASTSQPFYWYNLQEESVTQLVVHSPCLMDVTLKNYLSLTPDQAINLINELKMTLKEVGGNFEFIWHNSSFSVLHGWKGWKVVFEHLLSKRV